MENVTLCKLEPSSDAHEGMFDQHFFTCEVYEQNFSLSVEYTVVFFSDTAAGFVVLGPQLCLLWSHRDICQPTLNAINNNTTKTNKIYTCNFHGEMQIPRHVFKF